MADNAQTHDRAVACGLYRTSEPIEDAIEAGVLVYYHNHGDPGPGVYLPRAWRSHVRVVPGAPEISAPSSSQLGGVFRSVSVGASETLAEVILRPGNTSASRAASERGL